ncbi:hypothetical protein [Listeria ilorinensis]|uniref:hypothetical protein n=1 Tax=Listeria ilorinensis TaxID=2867439 RepID=UPI001EF43A50|nr:hypothetical protein [Listeria ilorinensis]
MEPKGKFFTYAIIQATAFLPYLLFILVGNVYDGWLGGWAPLIIYYVFNYTGTFLFNAVGIRLKARDLLLILLIFGVCGSVMASLADFSVVWIEIGAIFIGISSSMLVPLFTTMQYHERYFFDRKMTTMGYLAALLTILLTIPVAVLLIQFIYPWLAFLFYGGLLAISFWLLYRWPNYEVKEPSEARFLFRPFLIFLIFFVVIFLVKGARTTDWQGIAYLAAIASFVGLSFFFVTAIRYRPKLRLPVAIHYFSAGQGMANSFTLLYGTFFALSQHGFTFMMYGIYLMYFLGMILSLLVGPFVMKLWGERPALKLYIYGMTAGVILIAIPWTISAGVFIVCFFSAQMGRYLNRWTYGTAAEELRDSSLLLRSRWTKLGSIYHQVMLIFLLMLGSLVFQGLSVLDVVEAISGKGNGEVLLSDLLTTAMLLVLLIGSYLLYGWKKYQSVKK